VWCFCFACYDLSFIIYAAITYGGRRLTFYGGTSGKLNVRSWQQFGGHFVCFFLCFVPCLGDGCYWQWDWIFSLVFWCVRNLVLLLLSFNMINMVARHKGNDVEF
jgi:hypothetical protein